MIPKILHFIWISINGTKMPEYGRFAISKFKEMNPDFEINVIDLPNMIFWQDWKDAMQKTPFLQQAIIEALDKKINLTQRFKNQIEEMTYDNRGFESVRINIQTYISDKLRVKLLETYGGIYCDLDCFPLKPFDDEILSKSEGFCMQCNYHTGGDIFCIGGEPKKYNSKYLIPNPLYGKMGSKEFRHIKEKFINKTLSLDDVLDKKDIDSYIYHFYIGSKFN